MQTKIPCVLMRGGTSKGTFFRAGDLPADAATRDKVLLAVMGSPDERQIDGVGGGHPLTSKVAIVRKSERPGIDLDYLFVQVVVDEPRTSIKQNCGNMLAGVGPFAVEQGLLKARDGTTTFKVHMENSDEIAEVTFATPGGVVDYEGAARIDGVPGTASPVMIAFLETPGAESGPLLPTGNVRDTVQGIEITCVEKGMPVVIMDARALGRTGYETVDDLNNDTGLKARIEAIRLEAGPMMGLGDVEKTTVPKMFLVAPPLHGGAIHTRSFIPHVCHEAVGVFAAVSVGAACAIPGTVAAGLAVVPEARRKLMAVEHPSGEMTVEIEIGGTAEKPEVVRAGMLRTARRLFAGEVLIPGSVWAGARALRTAAE